MSNIVWLVLVMGYGLLSWAAGNFSKAALSFLDGGYLAFLCFTVLPHTLGTEHFYLAALAAGGGVLAGFLLESRRKMQVLTFAAVTGCQFFWSEPLPFGAILFQAVLGGIGLYHASAGVIPDKIEIGKALLSGAGFLIGTFLFAYF